MPDRKKKFLVTFEVEAVVRKGTTAEDLIMNQTEYIFEPKSANGCITPRKVKEIKEL